MAVNLSENEIKALIRRSDSYAIGALLNLCPIDPDDEGFRSYNDSKILNDVATFYLKKGYLTEKQVAMIRPKLEKYMHIILKKGVVPADTGDQFSFNIKKNIKNLFKKRKTKDAAKIDDETFRLEFPYDVKIIAEIKKSNGYSFLANEKAWTLPLTLTNIERAINNGFILDDALKQWYNEVNQGITEISIPDLDHILKPFQKKAVSFIETKNGRALIADQQGLGKTLESIAWIHYRKHKRNDIFPVLIVTPAAVKENWKNEFHKFTNLGDNVEVIYGETPYKVKKDIMVINFDIIMYWEKFIMHEFKPTSIIVDEIHKLKGNPNPGKEGKGEVKRVVTMRKLATRVKYFIGLSGTPLLNRPIELYSPLKMIKPTLFPNRKAYAYKYCEAKKSRYGIDYTGASNVVELHNILIKEVMLRRKKEDVLKELPDKIRSVIQLNIDNRKEYDRAYHDLINYLQEIDHQRAVRAMRAKTLAKINVLKQLAVAGKVNQAINWVEDMIENEKLVLFVYYKNTANSMYERFQKQAVKLVGGMSKKQRKDAENKFNEDENTRLFIGNIESAGTGLNLQVASHVAFLEFPWSPGLYSQCEDRCHRIGQKYIVNVWNLIAKNTIEEGIITKLENKAKTVAQVIDGEDADTGGIFNELIAEFYEKLRHHETLAI